MSKLPNDQEEARADRFNSSTSLSTTHSVHTSQLAARLEPYSDRKPISDVRRTFCLFVTFDLLFVGLLWIIELNLLAVFRFLMLVIAYALFRLNHWWMIAITTAVTSAFLIVKVIVSKLLVQGTAFAYLLPIISFILAWIETWFLDFKVLPQEAKGENRFFVVSDVSEHAPLILPGPLSDGQFYSPPESVADSDEEHDAENPKN
ncbi:STARD3 N-terminal-like protein isoform X2 [Rhincodon typus]|uniref:STARD3 N-terminal-like protein isoform X2 n=1 Tax=Rhincodon typus TaxID=259920 RepID=UPI002030DF8E|nr:STARD3 N-terminal-like protein isoform X2 [Rhincodon typus]